jgi:pyruvate,water dikinase
VILWLDQPEAEDRSRTGGKAAVLARLRRMGLPVPDGFVIAADGLPDREALLAAYERLGGAVAVRSSSTAEDLGETSFAGQYRTILDVRGAGALMDAVMGCLASSGDAAAYAQSVGASAGQMAVLVQRFVEPRAAGVAFGRDPSHPDRLLVESVAGRGEALVSGRASPDRYVLDRASTRAKAPVAGSLDANALAGVVALVQRVEDILGAPQDVEWAVDATGPVLLQARPITAFEEAPLDSRVRRLTRANVGEVLPDPVTPLTWTTLGAFLEHGFRSVAGETGLLPDGAPPFLLLHRERLFLNLSLCIDVAMRLPGISAADAEALVLGGGATGAPRPRFSLAALPDIARAGAGMLRLRRRLPAEVQACLAEIAALPPADSGDLVSRLDGFVSVGRRAAVTHIATSGSSAFRLSTLRQLLAAWSPGDAGERLSRLMAGLEGVASAEPTLALEAIAEQAGRTDDWRAWLAQDPSVLSKAYRRGEGPQRLREQIDQLLARFGHRALSEGELRSRAWRDDPMPVFAALSALLRSPRPAGFGRAARAEWRWADEQAVLSRLGPLRRLLAAWAIREAQAWVRHRERTKSAAVALVAHGRDLARRAAARLPLREADDVFFLTIDELRAGLGCGEVGHARVARRRRRFEREGALPISREITLGGTDGLPETVGSSDLRGIAVSGGVGLGRARVVAVGETATLVPGEVLVAPVLDAAFGPQLAVAAGAVAEIGGILSHGSVVARELGVPCVVDVRDATRAIRTGERILVDGNTGRVERVEEGTAAAHTRTQPLTPTRDEGPSALEDHPLTRESVYFNAQDPRTSIAIVASLGRRRGGRGESLLAIALADGRVLFGLDLAPARIETATLRVAGAETTWEPVRLRYRGRLAVHEASAFPPGPLPLLLAPRVAEVELDLVLAPTTPAIDFCDGMPVEVLASLESLGRHHVEQSGRFTGHVSVDGTRIDLEGTGSRDHSWGRRDWEAADHWRLFTVRFGEQLAVHALTVSVRGRRVEGGFVWQDGQLLRVTRVEYAAKRRAGRIESLALEVTPEGAPPLLLSGRVERTITVPVSLEHRPWRHLVGRPYRLLLHENYTIFTIGERIGHGMAEFTERPL